MRLPTQGYAIRIKEMEAGAGEVRLGSLMAMDPRGGQVELPGEHMREPAFGLPATWIDDSLREEATFRGYTIVDPVDGADHAPDRDPQGEHGRTCCPTPRCRSC